MGIVAETERNFYFYIFDQCFFSDKSPLLENFLLDLSQHANLIRSRVPGREAPARNIQLPGKKQEAFGLQRKKRAYLNFETWSPA